MVHTVVHQESGIRELLLCFGLTACKEIRLRLHVCVHSWVHYLGRNANGFYLSISQGPIGVYVFSVSA